MKKKENVGSLLEMIKGLSKSEKSALADQIMAMLGEQGSEKRSVQRELVCELTSEKPDCPHCAAKASLGYIVKKGMHKGVQRFLCKSCGKKFVATTGTAFARTRKDAETWRRFIQMTISGGTLRECMEECGISYQVAFNWRHKILNAFEENQKATQMAGNVEADEMLIPISYKGNHVQGGFGPRKIESGAINNMPRKAYCRGTDNKSMSSKEKACVFCMVENGSKAFYAAVPGVGFMSEEMLDATVAKHVNKESALMLVDDYKITKKYFENNGYNHVALRSNTSDNPKDHKVEVKDGLHVQHVNNMHHQIRDFLKPYCGVSSKYLSNYIALFVWLKTVRASKQKKTADKVSAARAATPDCYITGRQIYSRPAVPKCA